MFKSNYFGIIRIVTVAFIGATQSQLLPLTISPLHREALQGVLVLGTSHTSSWTSVVAIKNYKVVKCLRSFSFQSSFRIRIISWRKS